MSSPMPTSATVRVFTAVLSPGIGGTYNTGAQRRSREEAAGAVHQIGPNRQHTADRCRCDDGLADADDDVDAHHGGQDRVERRPGEAADGVDAGETQRRGRYGHERGDERRAHDGSLLRCDTVVIAVKTAHPTTTVTIAISVIFTPSAVRPPSAKANA